MNDRHCPGCGRLKQPHFFRSGKGFARTCNTCRFTEEVAARKRKTWEANQKMEAQFIRGRRGGDVPEDILRRLSWLTPVYVALESDDNPKLLQEIEEYLQRKEKRNG